MMITQDEVRRLFDYDPTDGALRWKVSRQRIVRGAVAGSDNGDGYIQICVNGHRYLAHRLVWLFHHGSWPTHEIDHINRNRTDNRIENLRDLPRSENVKNKSNNVLVEIEGIGKTVSDWAREFGKKPITVFNRLRLGWSIERALNT